MKKWIVSSLALALLLGAAAFIFVQVRNERRRQEAEKPRMVDVATLRDIVSVVSATGFVQPIQATEVKAEITGRILKIHVANNDIVKAGQLLLEIDPVLLQPKRDEAERTYQSQVLTLDQTRRDYERQASLREKNYTTEKAYEEAKTSYEIAKIQLEVLRARLDEATENLAKAKICAPHDGVVSDLNVTEGQVIVGAGSVSNGTTVMKINDLSKMYVDTDVNEIDINRVGRDSAATVAFDALPETKFAGCVTEISGTAVSRNSLRVFPVKIVFDVADRRVYPGITAAVSIPVTSAKNVVSVIISSVFTEGDKRYVFVEEGEGVYRKQAVRTGISDASYVEITQGLKAGDVVSLVRPPQFSVVHAKRQTPAAGGARR